MFRISLVSFAIALLLGIANIASAGGCGGCGMGGHEMGAGGGHGGMELKNASNDHEATSLISVNLYVLANGKQRFVDPISGHHADVTDATPHHDMGGKRYYFSKESDMTLFMSDMDKYSKSMVVPANIVKEDGNGATIKCPVTGDEAPLSSQLKFSDYNGKRYYFCCAGCDKPFNRNPEKYVK